MELFRSTLLIRPENFEKAAEALFAPDIVSTISIDAGEIDIIKEAFGIAGLLIRRTEEGIVPVRYIKPEFPGFENSIDFMERVFKAISRSVEPGSYIEFKDDDALVRYVFLFDTVERWTVPHILYAKKEEI